MRRFFTMLLAMQGLTAQAGGFVIGGGEYVRDGRNPWWLQNTTDVTYCISQDPSTEQPEEVIKKRPQDFTP